MKIEIKEENYKQLVQCIYLGNLIINEYSKPNEVKTEYTDFVDSVLLQIVKASPKKNRFKYKKMPNEKTEDTMLADLHDRIEDSVKDFYVNFCNFLFLEMVEDFLSEWKLTQKVQK